MLSTRVRVTTDVDASGALGRASEAYLMDMASAGFDASQERIAERGTDTGQLLRSGAPPEPQRDGSVIFGYGASYAPPVDEGAAPHWAPIQPLKGWARRVLGDESAAYAVQQKIAREGTEGIGITDHATAVMRQFATANSLSDYLGERL